MQYYPNERKINPKKRQHWNIPAVITSVLKIAWNERGEKKRIEWFAGRNKNEWTTIKRTSKLKYFPFLSLASCHCNCKKCTRNGFVSVQIRKYKFVCDQKITYYRANELMHYICFVSTAYLRLTEVENQIGMTVEWNTTNETSSQSIHIERIHTLNRTVSNKRIEWLWLIVFVRKLWMCSVSVRCRQPYLTLYSYIIWNVFYWKRCIVVFRCINLQTKHAYPHIIHKYIERNVTQNTSSSQFDICGYT